MHCFRLQEINYEPQSEDYYAFVQQALDNEMGFQIQCHSCFILNH
jgi:hypothetical protein